jgi:hypothetical protein
MADHPLACSFGKVLNRLTQPNSRYVVAPLNPGIGELIEHASPHAITAAAVSMCRLVKADQVALLMGAAGLLPTLKRDTEGLRQLCCRQRRQLLVNSLLLQFEALGMEGAESPRDAQGWFAISAVMKDLPLRHRYAIAAEAMPPGGFEATSGFDQAKARLLD